MDDAGHNLIGAWIAALATLVAGRLDPSEIKLRLGAYVPLLAEEFPHSRYFTNESLRYVARHSKWFPSYAELCDLLAASWKTNLPMLPGERPRESTEPYQLPPAPEWCFDA